MSTKKRVRPSPAADSAQPDIDDAALRKALADKKRAKSKAAFEVVLAPRPPEESAES